MDGNTTPSVIIPTKAIYGIETDPFHAHRFASYGDDGIIRLWDIRKPSEPVFTMTTGGEYRQGIGALSWSNLRSGLLACVGKDSNVLKLWDMQDGVEDKRDNNVNLVSSAGMKATGSVASLNEVAVNRDSDATNPNNMNVVGNVNELAKNTGIDRVPVVWKSKQCELLIFFSCSGNQVI